LWSLFALTVSRTRFPSLYFPLSPRISLVFGKTPQKTHHGFRCNRLSFFFFPLTPPPLPTLFFNTFPLRTACSLPSFETAMATKAFWLPKCEIRYPVPLRGPFRLFLSPFVGPLSMRAFPSKLSGGWASSSVVSSLRTAMLQDRPFCFFFLRPKFTPPL